MQIKTKRTVGLWCFSVTACSDWKHLSSVICLVQLTSQFLFLAFLEMSSVNLISSSICQQSSFKIGESHMVFHVSDVLLQLFTVFISAKGSLICEINDRACAEREKVDT